MKTTTRRIVRLGVIIVVVIATLIMGLVAMMV